MWGQVITHASCFAAGAAGASVLWWRGLKYYRENKSELEGLVSYARRERDHWKKRARAAGDKWEDYKEKAEEL